MSNSMTKSAILSLLHFAREQELLMISLLSKDELNEHGSLEHWSAKDFLANILHWKHLQTEKIVSIRQGEQPPVWKDPQVVQDIDRQVFLKYQNVPFQAVCTESEQVYAAFIAQVELLSEEELNDPLHYPWQDGEPVRGETLGNGLWQPCTQISNFYLQHNRREHARQLQEAMLTVVRQSGMPAENLGVIIYNQACFYTMHGWSEQALQLLPEAFQLRPTLVEWSRHDPDLDQLRANPVFQAIYADHQPQAPVSPLLEAQELYNAMTQTPAPFIIDVRGTQEYNTGHLQGAINIPLAKLEQQLALLPAERPIVTYCNMHHPGESRGERAAVKLTELGYPARALNGGYPGWLAQALPTEVK